MFLWKNLRELLCSDMLWGLRKKEKVPLETSRAQPKETGWILAREILVAFSYMLIDCTNIENERRRDINAARQPAFLQPLLLFDSVQMMKPNLRPQTEAHWATGRNGKPRNVNDKALVWVPLLKPNPGDMTIYLPGPHEHRTPNPQKSLGQHAVLQAGTFEIPVACGGWVLIRTRDLTSSTRQGRY